MKKGNDIQITRFSDSNSITNNFSQIEEQEPDT